MWCSDSSEKRPDPVNSVQLETGADRSTLLPIAGEKKSCNGLSCKAFPSGPSAPRLRARNTAFLPPAHRIPA
jgi:hypothetical protein